MAISDQSYLNSGVAIAGEAAAKTVPYISKAGFIAVKVFGYYALYSMYEGALSNLLCLKTYRHGTDLYAFVRIHIEGNDPNRGGTGGEARWFNTALQEESPFAERDHGRFYVVEDVIDSESKDMGVFAGKYYKTKRTLKYYAMRSNISFWGSLLPLPHRIKATITKKAVESAESESRLWFLLGALCPSVKIHLNPDDVNEGKYSLNTDLKFFRDGNDSYEGEDFEGACYTNHKFSVLDMGILGVIKNGFNRKLIERIQNNRGQFLFGVAQAVAAIVLTLLFFPTVLPVAVTAKITLLVVLSQQSVLADVAAKILAIPIVTALLMTALET